jgi:hypothetical protein
LLNIEISKAAADDDTDRLLALGTIRKRVTDSDGKLNATLLVFTPYGSTYQVRWLTPDGKNGMEALWRDNAKRQGVAPAVVDDMIKQFNLGEDAFDKLAGYPVLKDPDGKTFFLMPKDISGEDARNAVLLTYVFNAGTDYGKGTDHSFPPTPYSADEAKRIDHRQQANSLSYEVDVSWIHESGGRMVTTPNGMLMSLGGNKNLGLYSGQGGTTWQDIFMVNIDNPPKGAIATLQDLVEGGVMLYQEGNEKPDPGNQALDLDRLLHHEELHSQQYAQYGYHGFLVRYGAAEGKAWLSGSDNSFEKDAGLTDGGYSEPKPQPTPPAKPTPAPTPSPSPGPSPTPGPAPWIAG